MYCHESYPKHLVLYYQVILSLKSCLSNLILFVLLLFILHNTNMVLALIIITNFVKLFDRLTLYHSVKESLHPILQRCWRPIFFVMWLLQIIEYQSRLVCFILSKSYNCVCHVNYFERNVVYWYCLVEIHTRSKDKKANLQIFLEVAHSDF